VGIAVAVGVAADAYLIQWPKILDRYVPLRAGSSSGLLSITHKPFPSDLNLDFFSSLTVLVVDGVIPLSLALAVCKRTHR
jgi:hypothetical protein